MKALTIFAIASLAAVCHSGVVSKNFLYKHDGKAMEGYVAYDSARKQAPVVLIVHDWNGIDSHEKQVAARLAQMGYIAFAIDVYGKGVRPKTVKDCEAEATKYYSNYDLLIARLRAGMRAGFMQPGASTEKCAAIGYCFGGMSVLEMARAGLKLRGVVSFHGSLGTKHPAQPQKVFGRVLALHGADDSFVLPEEVGAFKREMGSAGVLSKFISYPGAGHSFTVRGSEKLGFKGVGYNAKADRDSWTEMKGFLRSIFGKGWMLPPKLKRDIG